MNVKHKNELYGEQDGKCSGCGERLPIRNLTLDHVAPKSKGGADAKANLQLLCAVCNSVKGTRSQAEFMQELRRQGLASFKTVSLGNLSLIPSKLRIPTPSTM